MIDTRPTDVTRRAQTMAQKQSSGMHSAAQRRGDGTERLGTDRPATDETGSVWWAEVGLGCLCWVGAAGVVLAGTSLGPFAALTVTYGPALTLVYLVFAVGIGLVFLAAGLDRCPWVGETAAPAGTPGRPGRDA